MFSFLQKILDWNLRQMQYFLVFKNEKQKNSLKFVHISNKRNRNPKLMKLDSTKNLKVYICIKF